MPPRFTKRHNASTDLNHGGDDEGERERYPDHGVPLGCLHPRARPRAHEHQQQGAHQLGSQAAPDRLGVGDVIDAEHLLGIWNTRRG